MTRRLFTFGCSFTQYNWPTWADLLCLEEEFKHSANWGCAGLGNRAIAERVAECSVRAEFTPNDVVIVQWSSHFRHDWMHTKMPIDEVSLWRTKGSIFSPPNHHIFDEQWIRKFWDEKAYYIHTLNSIALVQGLLNASGCEWYMTSLNDLSKIGNTVDQDSMFGDFHNPNKKMITVWDIEHSMLDYKRSIWDNHADKWIEPMTDFRDKHSDLSWYFETVDRSPGIFGLPKDGKYKESHMSMDQHVLFLKKVKNKLNLLTSINNNQQELINEVNKIKNKNLIYDNFLEEIKKTNWGSTLIHKGY